jgi:hypothetical protein
MSGRVTANTIKNACCRVDAKLVVVVVASEIPRSTILTY